MLRHLASLLLLTLLAVLAIGSNDSGSRGSSSTSSGSGTSSQPAVTTGQDKQISGDHRFGCSDREYFERLVGYAVQKDNQAFSQGLAAGLLAGTCTMLKAGESVYITDTAIFSGLVEVRRKGETQEFWTNLEAVD
jgi:hypothetical protein